MKILRIKILKHLYLGILLLTSVSCASQSVSTESRANVFESINADSHNGLYYQTFSSKDISNLKIDLQDLNFWNPCKYELEKEDFLLKEKEILSLNNQFKTLKSVILESDSPNLKLEKDPENTKLTFITSPILFRNDNFAVFYSEQQYGGQINLLKKENEKWIKYCSYIVWIE